MHRSWLFRRSLALVLVACSWAASGPAARAHFLWLGIDRDAQSAHACAWFAEAAEPGSAALVDRIAATKAWRRTVGSEPQPLELSAWRDEDHDQGAIRARLDVDGSMSLEAVCRYGVFQRGETAMLLTYYAQHLAIARAADLAALARAEALSLDIVPQLKGRSLRLTVFWQDAPVADAEVVVIDPDGGERTLSTDAQGQVEWPQVAAGMYQIRARVIEPDAAGQWEGKPYTQAWNFATLTLALSEEVLVAATADASAAPTITASANASLTADALLARARAARAVWSNFPGSTAALVVHIDGEEAEGRIAISPAGEVTLEGFDKLDLSWVRQVLTLVVRHRLPDPFSDDHVHYGDEADGHPLGRLVAFEGDPAQSVYRIKEDVVREVNRDMGAKTRFTISVLETVRNAHNKYLPLVTSVSYWDKESGRLRSNETHYGTWLDVGGFDMPERYMVVMTGANQSRRVLELVFGGHQLEPSASTAQAGGP